MNTLKEKKIIFNASMPRSGSELLQVILHQNPKIYGSTTSPLLEYQFAARGNYNLPEVKSQDPILMQKAFISMCKYMANGYYSEITERPIVCDKNRGWSHYQEWLAQWNPNPKVICMVRDLRSVVASMEKIYRKTRHLPDGPDNPANIQNMTVAQRTQYWLTTQPIGLALARTMDCFQRDIAKDMLFVKYEDLCNNPKETIEKVYAYIEEPLFKHDFKNIEKQIEEDDSVFGVYGEHDVKTEIIPVKENSWIDILPKDIAYSIIQNNSWFYNTFNY